jgi:hypothetical protein
MTYYTPTDESKNIGCNNCAYSRKHVDYDGGNCPKNKDGKCLTYGLKANRIIIGDAQWVNNTNYNYSQFNPYIEEKEEKDMFSDKDFEL